MVIVDLGAHPEKVWDQAAALLVDGFREPRGWSNLSDARHELAVVLRDGFVKAAMEGDTLLGWIGGIPNPGYGGRVWELHPMVVRPEHRRRGVGRALVEAFETEAARRGALTVTLGTDDDSAMTSLSDVDLFADLPRHIADVRDLGRWHPFLFYRKCGYVITGVMPNANGPGRPDIYMSKPIRR